MRRWTAPAVSSTPWFHSLVAGATPDDLQRKSDGTEWTNRQLLFHMLFGYLITLNLRVIVRLMSRAPDRGATRVCWRAQRHRPALPQNQLLGLMCRSHLRYACTGGRVVRPSHRITAPPSRSRDRRVTPSNHAFPRGLGPVFCVRHEPAGRLPLRDPAFRPPPPAADHELTKRLSMPPRVRTLVPPTGRGCPIRYRSELVSRFADTSLRPPVCGG